MDRSIALVSGAPGAGKTTLALQLSRSLQVPLFAKDAIKETLWDVLQPPSGDLEWSRRLGGAAMELLWVLAAHAPAAVLEANFRPQSPYERSKLAALEARIVEVYCRCPPVIAARRYEERAAGPSHHPAHVLPKLSDEQLAEFDRPVALGEVIEVDTTEPVDVTLIAARVAELWGPPAPRRSN